MKRAVTIVVALVASAGLTGAETARPHRLDPAGARAPGRGPGLVSFNQSFIEGLYHDLDVSKPLDVFALVFSELSDEVKVYPTENYYYFSFNAAGRTYWGNLRLDASDRDDGLIHVGYFVYDDNGERQDREGRTVALGEEHGVLVEHAEPYAYDVTYDGRRVRFQLNQLTMQRPRKARLRPCETFIGPIFDESGLRFFLIYDRPRKHFMYLLDEDAAVPETFERVKGSLLIGLRTSFAFFEDEPNRRKILVAVHGNSTDRNSYYDGPFDQLPDNLARQTRLSEYLVEAYPYTKGRIDVFGGYRNGRSRVMVFPYNVYYDVDDLGYLHECREKSAGLSEYYECLTPDFAQRIGSRFEADGAKSGGPAGARSGR